MTCLPDAGFLARVNGVVALGGDPTMLGTMRLVAGRTVAVLGVDDGHLGFVVEVDPSGLENALNRLATGEFTIELHPGLVTSVDAGPPLVVFNDVVLIRPGTTGSVMLDLAVKRGTPRLLPRRRRRRRHPHGLHGVRLRGGRTGAAARRGAARPAQQGGAEHARPPAAPRSAPRAGPAELRPRLPR